MNASVLSLWRVRVLAVALAVVGAGVVSLMMASSAFAAAPTGFTSQTYSDSNADGQIDTVTVVINGGEALDACVVTDTEVGTDWTYVGGVTFGGGLAVAGNTHSCVTGTATVTLKLLASTAGVTGGGTAPTIAYNDGDADHSISNATGDLGTVLAQNVTDGARPVLLTSSPANGATNVSRSASIVLTFSEAISGDATWSHVGGPVFASFTETGTNVLTMAHTDLFSSGYHEVNISVASDATGNLFNGAVSGYADPFTFTVASSSSSSSSTVTEATYDIELTSPNGGEELTPGQMEVITWDSTATGSAMGFVNINISYTEGGSTTTETIVTGTPNDGSYAWMVPNIDTDSATIQVVGTDLVESLATDESDADFTIGWPVTDDTTEEDTTVDEGEDTTDTTGTTGLSPVTGEEEEISDVAEGDYVRSPYFDTVYYIDEVDGELVRRPFLDAQTFLTYANDWDDVVTVTDATLPTLELGSPMLPKAGVVLIKIQSDARTFAIEGDGTIRWIATEEVAIAIYGADWADYVIDVSATLFPRFTEGDDIDGVENTDTDGMKTRAQVNS